MSIKHDVNTKMAALSEDEDDELTRDLESLNEILQGGKSAELPFAVETANQGDDQSTDKLKQCLQKNYEVQAGLQKQLDKLEVAIAANKLKLDTVTAPRRGKMLQRRMSMASFRRGKYFKDHLGFSPPICHEGAGESYAELDGIHRESPWVRGPAENRLVEGVRFQLIEGRTRPLLSQLNTDNLSEDDLSEARLKDELVLAKVEAIKAQSDKELYNDLTVEEVNWSSLSYEMFGHKRSENDCRLHWTNHATPMLNKEAWSSQENKNLVKIAGEYEERDWVRIARELGTGRSAFACLRQFQTARNQGKSGGRWSEEEDMKLKSAMNLYGLHNWVKVAHYVGTGRSSMNCYHRWTMSLCPDLKRGKWSLEEDEQLIEGVRIHGKKAWSKVCQFVPGRSQSQCRERYLNVLNSDLKKGPFTMDEDRILLEACKPYEERTTCIPWSKIAKGFLPQRTDAMCSIRWKQLKSDDEVFRQYTNQALKRYAHPIKPTPTPSLVDNTDLPEVVKEQVKKFKYRYTTRDKRKSSAINPDSYPSPDTIISWDNSELNDHLTLRQNYALQFLPSYNFRRYSAALKNGSSMFSPLPLHDSRNKEGQSSTSRSHSDQDPNNDQTMDETVQNIISNLRGGTTSANFSTPLNEGQQLESRSTPEPIDLTQDDDEMSTSSNVTAGNHHVALRTTGAKDTVGPAYDDHAPMTSDPTLKLLPRSILMPPAESATRTKTDSVRDNVESIMNTKQNSENSDTTPLMINDTVSCDLNAHTPTLVTGGSNLGAPTNIGTLTYSRDGNRIVIVPGTAGTKSDVINTMRGEGDFPVGPRFVLRPLFSEQSLETTAASNIDNDGAEETGNQYNNVLDKDTPHQEELNAVTTVATTMRSIFSVSEDISTNENGGQSIFLGDETTACVVLPSDYGMSQGYSVDLHMVDGVSLINSGGDNANRTSVTYSRPLGDSNILYSGSQLVSTSSGPNTTTSSIVSNTPVISNSASSGNFTEIERSLAAELLRFTPRTDYRTKTDEKRLKLEEFVFEMAGFDLPIQIATEKDVLMEADARMIVYEPNHMCYRRFPRAYRRKNVTPLSNEDLISRHFALSQVSVPSVKVHVFTDKIINAAIVGDYHFRLQVYASYDILIYDTYCPKPKNQHVAKPWKRPTTTGQKKSTGGKKPKVSPQPNKTKRMYVQKKGAASKTVEDDANQQVAKPRKRPTTTGQKKSTTGDSRKRKNIETPNSPQPKKTKRTYVQRKGVTSKIVEDVAPSNGSSMAAAKKCTKRAPAKSLQRTPKQPTKTATEFEPNTDPPSTEQATKVPSNESVERKRSYRKRKCPPEYSNTSEQSAATPSTSRAMDCTTTPSHVGPGGSKRHSNKNQTPRIEDGDETANIDVIVVSPPPVEDGDETATPSEAVKRRRKTVKYY